VAVEATISDDLVLCSNDIGVGTDNHVGINSVHDIRIASFADSYNDAVLDTNIGLIDTSVVNNQSISHDQIQAVGICASRSLTHTITNTLTTTKGALIAVSSEVFLNFDPKIGGTQTDDVASGRAKHGNVGFTLESEHVKVSRIASRLWSVMEATLPQFLDKVFRNPSIMEGTSSKTATTFDDLVSTDLDEIDGLGITGLETDGGSSSNIQPVSQSSNTIEIQERIGLDKVIV
jgi:hypothetical protein